MQRVPLLDKRACSCIATIVLSLRQFWIPRQREPCSFFTLGRASYMDAKTSTEEYLAQSVVSNKVLKENFADLYASVTSALSAEMGTRCALTDDFALPGFHIWLSHAIPRRDVASVHFDLQYQGLGAEVVCGLDADAKMSFTLPIRLPLEGGGLNVWDLTYDEFLDAVQRGYVTSIDEMKRFKAKTRVPYHIGEIFIHNGEILHQIAGVVHVGAEDERICLQGHGIRRDGIWELYW